MSRPYTKPLEKDIEAYMGRKLRLLGCLCEKFTSPGKRSVPDRLISIPGGSIMFVELKSAGNKPTVKQAADHKRRRELGFDVRVIDSKEQVNELVNEIQTRVARLSAKDD